MQGSFRCRCSTWLIHEPKFVLDVGCRIGDFAAVIKTRFSSSRCGHRADKHAPPSRAAASNGCSANRSKMSTEKRGCNAAESILFCFLTCWSTSTTHGRRLLTLRNLVSPTASPNKLPNCTNAPLIRTDLRTMALSEGGLLDITHIRSFTPADMYRMLYQTGFRVVTDGVPPDVRLSAESSRSTINGSFPRQVKLDSVSILFTTARSFGPLHRFRHVFILQPVEIRGLCLQTNAPWIDAPPSATVAYAPYDIPENETRNRRFTRRRPQITAAPQPATRSAGPRPFEDRRLSDQANLLGRPAK